MPVQEAPLSPEILELVEKGSRRLQEFSSEVAKENLLGDLTDCRPSELIAVDRVLRFWCMDAVVRLLGDLPKSPDWEAIFKEAYRFAARLDFDILTRLAFHSRDRESVFDLIRIRVGRDATRREIFRRFEQLRFGKVFRKYLATAGFAVGELLDVTESQIRAWLRVKKISIAGSPRKNDLLKSLKMPLEALPRFPARALRALRALPELRTLRPPRSAAKEVLEKSSRELVLGEMLEDDRSEAILTIHELYDKLKKAVETDLYEIPTNPIMERRPFGNPAWERALRGRMLRDIEGMLTEHLPILDGNMEKAPLKVHDKHRTRVRRELRWKRTTSWDEFEEQEQYGEGDKGHPLSKLEIQLAGKRGIAEQETKLDVKKAKEEFNAKLQTELKTVNPPKKRMQVRRAMILLVITNKTAKEVARIAHIDEKTVRKYKQKLGL
ncbi:MAG: hypothetical protein IH856_04675 [Deltaproteobacteria bacterium]|nr:hypothetical protein [Deltaproteobacteria bacterium]